MKAASAEAPGAGAGAALLPQPAPGTPWGAWTPGIRTTPVFQHSPWYLLFFNSLKFTRGEVTHLRSPQLDNNRVGIQIQGCSL